MWPNQQLSADLVTFTEEIFNGKRYLFFFLFILFLFIYSFIYLFVYLLFIFLFVYLFIYLTLHQQQLTNGSSIIGMKFHNFSIKLATAVAFGVSHAQCDCPEGQSICSYSYWFEFITIPNRYNTMKEF